MTIKNNFDGENVSINLYIFYALQIKLKIGIHCLKFQQSLMISFILEYWKSPQFKITENLSF